MNIVYNEIVLWLRALRKGEIAMNIFSRKLTKSQLERAKTQAEIREIDSRSFTNYCEGLAKITPLVKIIVTGIVTIILILI